MIRFLLVRAAQAVVVLLVVSAVAFGLAHLSGDPARLMAPAGASDEDIAQLQRALGLDRPLWEQYADFVLGAARGDLGQSLSFRQPVWDLIASRVPATAELGVAAMGIATVLGLPLGVVAAARHGGLIDAVLRTGALLGQSVPLFWLGLVMIMTFALNLGWFPSSGRGDLSYLVLPAVTLSIYPLSQILRLTRAEVLETLHADFIRTARSKGVSEFAVLGRHALRNAVLPVITVIGLQLGAVLGGAILTETIFAWPGLGRLAVQAVAARDYPLLQGIVVVLSASFIFINALVDILYAVADPRVREQR